VTNSEITNLATPTCNANASSKQYVDTRYVKINIGFIPCLESNSSKAGVFASCSNQMGPGFQAIIWNQPTFGLRQIPRVGYKFNVPIKLEFGMDIECSICYRKKYNVVVFIRRQWLSNIWNTVDINNQYFFRSRDKAIVFRNWYFDSLSILQVQYFGQRGARGTCIYYMQWYTKW
jgi:hypothetical protein